MDRTENGPDTTRSGLKNTFQDSVTTTLQENELLSPSRRSKRLQKENLLESKISELLPVSKELPNANIVGTTQIASSIGKSCCSINSQCGSSEHLFGLFDQEFDHSPGTNHKFYGCKRKGYPSPCSESFALPDDPIFSNSPIFIDRTRKSSLDIDLADPWDITVLDVEYANQPWLVEYPEVITPYWDVESLFPFEVEDIRQKLEPEDDLTKQSDSFDISDNMLDVSVDNDGETDNVFTSTPVKNQNNSNLSVVSTISISNGEDNNVNIAVIKDEVLKALEEAIKNKTTLGNIDMKIQIITSDPKSPVVSSPKKNSVKLRIDKNVETESCKSPSSSKENYFVTSAREKSQKLMNTKELSHITVSNLNEDWQDGVSNEVNDDSQNELNEVQVSCSTKENKKLVKNKRTPTLGVRRSLRSKDISCSTPGDKGALGDNSIQSTLQDNPIIQARSKGNKVLKKTRTIPNQLNSDTSPFSQPSQQTIEIDLGSKKEGQSKSIKIKESKPNDLEPSQDVFIEKPKEKPANEGLQFSQVTDENKFSDQYKRSRFRNEDSQSSQDEGDSYETVGRNKKERVRRGRRSRELQSLQKQDNVEETSVEKPRRSGRFINFDLQTSHNQVAKWNTSIGKDKPKQIKVLLNDHTLSSQDESNTNKTSMEKCGYLNDSQLNQNEQEISDNVLELSISETLRFTRKSDTSINLKSGRKQKKDIFLKEDFQFSQDESDVSRDEPDRSKRKGRPRGRPPKAKKQQIQNNLSDSTKDHTEDISPTKRILRPRPQQKLDLNDTKAGRRRTVSTSSFEKIPREQNYVLPSRKRSVSVNFDSNKTRTPLRRSLRNQTIEQIKSLANIKPEYTSALNNSPKEIQNMKSSKISFNLTNSFTKSYTDLKDSPKEIQNMKSSKISFNLTNSFTESPKKFQTDSPIKSILKNVYDSRGRLIGVKVHREKQLKMLPSSLDIKPEDHDDEMSASKVKHPVIIPDLNSVKNEEDYLREKGITSRIKIVISPLEIKEEKEEKIVEMCPVITLALPKIDVSSVKELTTPQNSSENNPETIVKSGKISNVSQEKTIEDTAESIEKSKRNNGKINNIGDKVNFVEAKEVKIEDSDYNLGSFVWAHVGKYPYWPAIVCNDPITQTFQKEVIRQNMAPQIYYHIRFFGDHGRRAWVFRKNILLYCSDQDLEMIATKLKSENKHYSVVKPYIVVGSIQMENWTKAVQELNLLKDKHHDAIIEHMLDSYVNYLNSRKNKRRSRLDASSESESEEPDTMENRRRKKFKFSEPLHVTADTQLMDNTFQTKNSQGFDEITISAQTIGVTTVPLENVVAVEKTSENTQNSELIIEISNKQNQPLDSTQVSEPSDKITPRRSARSLKPVESFNITAESPSSDTIRPVENWEVSEPSETSLIKTGERRSLRAPKSSLSNEASSSQSGENDKMLSKLSRKQTDESSEAESKTSSNSNMYSFEYQMDLHKKNYLFNGLTKVRVCDYCLKPGDLFKCKGRCGGFFHLVCASNVTQPFTEKRVRRREKSPNKAKVRNMGSAAPSVDSTPKSEPADGCRTRNQCQVQIITIKSKHAIGTPKKVNLPANFDELSLSEQIDYGMKEMMSKFENRTIYVDSTDSSSEEGSIIASKNKQLGVLDSPGSSVVLESEKSASKSIDLDETLEEEKSSDDLEVSAFSENAEQSKLIKHVTADSVILTESDTPMDITNVKCTYCRLELDPPCFACGLEISKRGSSTRRKCSQFRCGRYYHPYCLKMWPQTQWSVGKWSRNQEQEDVFTCPAHTCHTCFSEELGSAACRLPGDKLVRCMLCPAGFHTTTFCIPAGTEILGGSQMVCPRHRPKPTQPINTIWCFICSEGGNLICCDTCPTSVHPECQPINLTDDDKYICEDCESGRFPLYDEIVWVKLGQYRWWPAIVLFPNEIPENVKALKHQRGDFAVRFFGTNDHYWVNKARSFLFQEGDTGGSPGEANKSKNKVYETFGQAIEDAALAYKLKKEFKLRREAESINSLKPPTYVKINKNKPVGNVKSLELDLSNATTCECDPNKPHPCGPDGNCINRLLMTECDPDVCTAGNRCRNQSFQKRDYPPMIPYKTQGRGWGLKCLAPIKKGQFVIEYVGELIDSEEYQRRIQKMHEQKEENYYFMTVDSDRMIDAGPKGNLSRFMNHCCNPNCVTQKWTVRGDTRVGLFAKCDIESGSELTFNYNLEVVGQEKKVCKCGAGNCSGFIGVKAKSDKSEKPPTDPVSEPSEPRIRRKYNKKRAVSPPMIPSCFMCSRKQSDLTCNNKFCNKGYHLRCLKLEEMPEVTKFTCPRHNCNICSNRTIRCCVKCTNSFCPSHSEGNVRHDKFLGFVCRLHDPGISSTTITSETAREQGKSDVQRKNIFSNKTESNNKGIYSYPPEKRDEIRAAWRMYKKRQYDKQRMVKTNLANVATTKQSSGGVKSKAKAVPVNKPLINLKLNLTQQKNGNETFNSEKLKKSFHNYLLCLKTKQGGISNVSNEDKEIIRARWREGQSRTRLKHKRKWGMRKSKKKRKKLTNTQKNMENIEGHSSTTNPGNDVIAMLQKDLSNDQNQDMASVSDNVAETIPSNVEDCNTTETVQKTDLNVQNDLVTSENHDNTKDFPDITESVRSEFEPIKSTKRRRPKPESTDESTVSSTTSDEDSKTPQSQNASEKEPAANTEINEVERDDIVSSTPPKEPAQENDEDTSEDETTLDKRIKRRSGVRNPRKKIKINIKSLTSTAKSS